MGHKLLLAILVSMATTFLGPPLVMALERCDIEEGFPTTRPIPKGGGPTELHVSLFLFDLVEIVTVKQEFTLDFFIHIQWKDLRVGEMLRQAGVKMCQVSIEQVWFPNMLLVNSRQHRTDLPRILHLSDDGTVKGNQRIFGTFAVQMNLKDFPLDSQVLPVTFISPSHPPEDLKPIFDASDREEIFTENSWKVETTRGSSGVYDLGVLSEKKGGYQESLARFDYEILVKRETAFYVWKVILPLSLIVMVSWAVFWIDPSQQGIQTGIGTGMLLSIIAFLFSLQHILPKINYLTRMDVFVYTSLIFVVLAFLETLLSCGLATQNRLLLAERMDRVSRVVFPVAFGGVITWFWWS